MKSIVTTVVAGTPVIFDLESRDWSQPIAVSVFPSGTASVETSLTPTAISDPNNARWSDSGSGVFSAATEISRDTPCVAIRFKAFSANAIFELMV